MTGWPAAIAVAVAVVLHDPRAPAADPKRALGLLVAVIALGISLARPPRDRDRAAIARPALVFTAFVAWSGVTLVWGVPAGARDLATWIAAAAIALTFTRAGVEEARRDAERAALLAGTVAAAVGLSQGIRGARGIFVHGGQGNANWLGLLLAVTIPLTVGMIARASPTRLSTRARLGISIALLVQLAGLAASHSRVAWAAIAVVAPTLVFCSQRRLSPAKKPLIAAALIALAIALPAVILTHSGAPSPARVADGEDVPVAVALQGRTWIWRSALDAARRAAPLGAGQGGFAHAFLDAQGERLASLEPRAASRRFLNATTAHSEWIEVLVDGGPVALGLLLFAFVSAVIHSLRGAWIAGAASLITLAVCASGDSPLRQPGVALLFGMVLAGAADPAVAASPPRLARVARIGLLSAAALALAASLGGWLGARRLTAAREALPAARRALLASAARLDPWSGEIALERGLFELEEGDAEAAQGALERSRELLAGVSVHVAIGNARARMGQPEAAIDAYRAALRRSPGSFRAHANLTQPLLALGRIDEAERHLAVAASLWPGNPRLVEMAEQVRRARIERATDL